ncbi:Neprilysin-11 [Parelaphostrongylus tenuis]|uniref:Neprilysin-11 n=1 Tax=Parelaphostrongylus tenuis TaxID=148309 RepID=A0AAD5MCD4_PARTN|nr:Neprilysin-11 [Parelaphostrongylus tenuis]
MALARRDYGVESFFQVYIYADAKNTSRNTLFVDQTSLSLGRGARDYYLNSTMFANHMQAYRKYFQEIVKILREDAKINGSEAIVEGDIDDVIAFEKKLAEIVVPEDERRNSTRLYNKRVVADLYEYMNDVDWVAYLQQIAPSEMVDMFNNDTEIVVTEIDFLRKASDLIKKTDRKILANYIVWRVVQASVRLLDERFENIKHPCQRLRCGTSPRFWKKEDFSRVMTGQQQQSPRWKECAQVPSAVLPLAAGAVYVQAHFNSEDKREALEMIENLRESFADLVNQNDWMDEMTKSTAILKANSMINNIGYPNITNDIKKLDEQYKDLVILPEDTYYMLMKKAVIWMQKKEFRKLLKPFDRHEFDVSPAVVNAFYSPEKNAITFPAGILQPPFFSGSFPKAVNYGAIGAVIGHEITHGFDDQGSQYDKDGNLHNWWSSQSLEAFDKRRRCIVEQYGNYTVPKTTYKVNGKLTQGENIADNGGVKEALRAYEKYVTQHGEEPRLPGLQQYTNTQIFFLSYAHFWCGQKKEAAAMQQVTTDEHSPEVFRVTGVLSNLHKFAEAFSCPVGSALNPSHKCVIW